MLKRSAVTIVGVALVAAGLAMMVLPGPGVLVLVAGIAVLATEYVWAQRLLHHARTRAQDAQRAAVASPLRTAGSVLFGFAMVGLGLAMVLVDDVDSPLLADLVDRVWGPVVGSVLVLTAVVLLVTTWMAVRAGKADAAADAEVREGS